MSSDEPPPLRRRERPAAPGRVDRLPPHNQEAEKAVLCCCLLDPQTCVNQSIELFGDVGADVFYDLRHQAIFTAMVELLDVNRGVDLVTLTSALREKNMLDQVGGIAYVAALPDVIPSAANLPYYAEELRKHWQARSVVRVCTDVIGSVYEGEKDVEGILDDAERTVLGVRQRITKAAAKNMRQVTKNAIDRIEQCVENKGLPRGLSTGLRSVDNKLGGLKNGHLIILAARPSVGKTSLAMNIVEHVAIDCQMPVGVFSLEMSTDELVFRTLCTRAKVNSKAIEQGFITEQDQVRLAGVASSVSKAPIYIDDTSGLSIMQLRARARRMKQQHGIRLLVVDYLQLMCAYINGRRIDKRQEEVTEISRGLAWLAKELDIPIVALSQLNRDLERTKRKPCLADLRESGSIEQDAWEVLLLHRPKSEDEEQKDVAVPIVLIVAKQRNGPVGECPLTFMKHYTKYEDAPMIDSEDMPEQPRKKNWMEATGESVDKYAYTS